MTVVATHDIDGQTVAVIEEREGDDSPFFELLVDGVRVDTDPFPEPPSRDAMTFEQQYTGLALAVDVIAERIRALGMRAPGSDREFARSSSIAEEGDVPDAVEMIRRLVAGRKQS